MARVSLNDRDFAIVAVRWLLGIQSLGSGLNWWIKILPFPNMHEPLVGPVKHEILRTMIESGWMFTSAKVIEVLLALALLFNRHVVFALVLSFPVMLMTYLLDLWPFTADIMPFLSGNLSFAALWAAFLDMLFFGGGVIVMQIYLMSEYFPNYGRLFVVRPNDAQAPAWSNVFESGAFKATFRWLSYTVGMLSTLWVVLMALHIVPWSSLAIMAPPH